MIAALLSELDHEAKTTRAVLRAVPFDRYDWKPHEKSMSLGALAFHVAQLPGWGGATLNTGDTDFTTMARPPKPASSEELLALYDKGVESLRSALKATTQDDLVTKSYTMRAGDKVFLTAPRVVYVRSIVLNHAIHHRGQLSVYLRLLDVPVPAIYGPSADENPWG